MWDAPSSAASQDAALTSGASSAPGRGFKLPRLHLPSVSFPSISLPRLRLPSISLPRPRLPKFSLPKPSPTRSPVRSATLPQPKTARPPTRRMSLPQLHFPRVKWPSIKFPRFTLPHLRLPSIRRPQLRMPQAPRLPMLKRPRPSLPSVSIPSPWAAIGRFTSRVTSRDFWARTRTGESSEGHDYTRFAVLVGGFSIVASVTLGVVLLASLFSGDSSQSAVPPFESSLQTSSPATSALSDLTETPWIDAQLLRDDPLAAANILWDTALATGAPELISAANHIRQAVAQAYSLNEIYLCPILDRYNADYSSGPAGAPACGDALVTPSPTGDISLALWANDLNAWLFGDLQEGTASYSEGDEAPFLLNWVAEPGEDYTVEITYACSVGGVPAIDFLAGVQTADPAIFAADQGPGESVPDAAVPLPDTPDLDADDGTVRLLYLFGGDFLLLPEGPAPATACSGERTITVPVLATADEVTLMGSVHFADADDHDGQGAADAADAISLSVSISAAGTATAGFQSSAIAP